MRKLYISGLALILSLAFPLFQLHADEYYIGQFEWKADCPGVGECWEAPHREIAVGQIDLRSIPEQAALGGVPEGHAVFAYSELVDDPNLLYFGDDKNAVISQKAIDDLKAKLGVAVIEATTPKEIVYELLTDHADPTGENGVKPVMPDKNLNIKVELGEEVIKETKLIPGKSKEWPKVLATLQNEYRILVRTDLAKVPRWLDALEDQFKVDYEYFIPDDAVIRVASLPHQTALSETWTCSNSDSLTCTYTWTEVAPGAGDLDISSNKIIQTVTDATRYARAETDLSSSNAYAQVERVNASAGTPQPFWYIFTRGDSSAVTFYVALLGDNATIGTMYLYKYVTGTGTGLGTISGLGASPANTTMRIEANGSAIKTYRNVTQVHSITDTAVTTGLRAGIGISDDTNSAADPQLDNFIASDLAGDRRVFITQ